MAQSYEDWIKNITEGCVEIILESWEEFVEIVKNEKECWPTLIFRGQANAKWAVLSTLDRLEKDYPKTRNLSGGVPKEFDRPPVLRPIQLDRFKELALDKISKDIKNDNVIWTIARHHGMATPLLDFTYSPLVALYVAFEEKKCDCNGELKEPENRAVFALTHHLLNEKGGVDDEKIKAIKELVQPFSAPGYGNYRAVSQAGLFVKMPQGKDLESYVRENYKKETYIEPSAGGGNPHPLPILRKYVIPSKNRIECLRFLDCMNINRATLFPDLDGIAKYINALWEFNPEKALGHIEQL